jgi:hypothetical protein
VYPEIFSRGGELFQLFLRGAASIEPAMGSPHTLRARATAVLED